MVKNNSTTGVSVVTVRLAVRVHQLLDGWIADCPYSKDSVCQAVEECLGRGRVVCADKTEIRRLETKMFHHAEKGLKLPPTLSQRDPLAS
jgi:hypothetical protein